MDQLVDRTFAEWTAGKNPREARVAVFERIRDIPYAVIAELVNYAKYADLLRINKGSCAPKHFLLCELYQRMGLDVLYVTYPFRWDALGIDYPPDLHKLAKSMPLRHHLACRVEIEGRLVLVDATIDLGLENLGLPVNKSWDGASDTLLPLEPLGEEEFYHPSEAPLMEGGFSEEALGFYRELNAWLESVRSGSGCGRMK
jgi:hypothetical protein